jgi:hypothetical protein
MAAAELKLIRPEHDSGQIVECLEHFLEMARRGELNAVVVCALDEKDRSHYRTARGRHGYLSHLVAISALAASNCLRTWDEAH